MIEFSDSSFIVEIGRHREEGDAVRHLERCLECVPDGRIAVSFGGYEHDTREVWGIDRCVRISKAIVNGGLLPRLSLRSAWFLYRVSTRMPEHVGDDYFLNFVELVRCSGREVTQ